MNSLMDKIYNLALSMEPGTTKRINHQNIAPNCKGESKSLKIVKEEDGCTYAYCFRCGASYNTKKIDSKLTKFSKQFFTSDTKDTEFKLPENFQLFADYSILGNWLSMACVNWQDLRHFNVGKTKGFRDVIFPYYDEKGLCLYQKRILSHKGPKYLTTKRADCKFHKTIFNRSLEEEPLVLVEDALSAIRVSKFCPSYPLLGNNASPEQIIWLTDQFDSFIIWLDNDNQQVKKNAESLYKILTMLGKGVYKEDKLYDPKYYSDHYMEMMLYDRNLTSKNTIESGTIQKALNHNKKE